MESTVLFADVDANMVIMFYAIIQTFLEKVISKEL